jgi:hypothetical protein
MRYFSAIIASDNMNSFINLHPALIILYLVTKDWRISLLVLIDWYGFYVDSTSPDLLFCMELASS